MPYGNWTKQPNTTDPDSCWEKLWKGNPPTYRIRDLWHKYPLIWWSVLLLLGAALGHLWW